MSIFCAFTDALLQVPDLFPSTLPNLLIEWCLRTKSLLMNACHREKTDVAMQSLSYLTLSGLIKKGERKWLLTSIWWIDTLLPHSRRQERRRVVEVATSLYIGPLRTPVKHIKVLPSAVRCGLFTNCCYKIRLYNILHFKNHSYILYSFSSPLRRSRLPQKKIG